MGYFAYVFAYIFFILPMFFLGGYFVKLPMFLE